MYGAGMADYLFPLTTVQAKSINERKIWNSKRSLMLLCTVEEGERWWVVWLSTEKIRIPRNTIRVGQKPKKFWQESIQFDTQILEDKLAPIWAKSINWVCIPLFPSANRFQIFSRPRGTFLTQIPISKSQG